MIWRRWRVEIGELPLDVLHVVVHLTQRGVLRSVLENRNWS